MSWVAVAVGAVSLGVGIYQTVDGNNKRKKAEKNRPEYESPREIAQNTNLAEQMAYEGLPMEQKRAFQREVQRSQAAALSSQGQLNAQLSGLAATNVASMDALSNMHVQDARARNENRRALMNQRGIAAQYRDREFAYDHQFYQQELDTANAMIGAGMQNIAGGAGMVASGASNIDIKKKQQAPPSHQFGYSPDSSAQMRNQLNPGGYPMSSEIAPTWENSPMWVNP